MAKIWDGPTPFDNQTMEWAPGGSMAGLKKDIQSVYRRAMNSPEVMGLYQALKRVRTIDLTREDLEAIAAYEAGLKELP